jgi:hypothetical protein
MFIESASLTESESKEKFVNPSPGQTKIKTVGIHNTVVL